MWPEYEEPRQTQENCSYSGCYQPFRNPQLQPPIMDSAHIRPPIGVLPEVTIDFRHGYPPPIPIPGSPYGGLPVPLPGTPYDGAPVPIPYPFEQPGIYPPNFDEPLFEIEIIDDSAPRGVRGRSARGGRSIRRPAGDGGSRRQRRPDDGCSRNPDQPLNPQARPPEQRHPGNPGNRKNFIPELPSKSGGDQSSKKVEYKPSQYPFLKPGKIIERYPDGSDVREAPARFPNTDKTGHVYELHRLQNSTGKHKTPDAMVYVSKNFDPSKPMRVTIFNHGLNTDVKEVFRNGQLRKQMADADPNTVLIVPEWQQRPQSKDKTTNFHQPNFFRNQLQEVLDKTPGLKGKRVDDIQDISIVAHSGGYNAAMSEVNRNGLHHKVKSITMLDALYPGANFDNWIGANLKDLASGEKKLTVVYTPGGGTAAESLALASKLQRLMRQNNLDPSAVVIDSRNHGQAIDANTLAQAGIVFKRSTVNVRDVNNPKAYRGSHSSVVNVSLSPIVQAEAQRVSGRV